MHSPTANEHTRQRSSSNPHYATGKRIAEHDSLVSIRLSEPPRQLTVNTDLPPNATIQRRRTSLFRNTLSPSSATTNRSPLSSPFDPNEALSPVTSIPNSDLKLNLQDELEGVDDDSKTIHGEGEDSDDEEVDWDQLQSKEAAESKDNEEDVG